MAKEDGRKADPEGQLSNIGGQHNERLTRRSTPHPSTKEHHEEIIAAHALIDFVDYSSVEYGFYEYRDCCQEDTDSKERCSLSKLRSQEVMIVKQKSHFVPIGQQLSYSRRKVMQ